MVGMDYGDEYLAELDHIEVVERAKEGYESDVPELKEKSFEDRWVGYWSWHVSPSSIR